jgi:dimethylargininase
MPGRVALTRGISDAFARCELTHLARAPIDVARARAQHEAYRQRLASLGCRIVELEADEALPDCVFVEDAALVFDELAVIARPGAPSRRAETAAVAGALAAFRPLRRIEPPDTLDGGDVLRLGRDVFVGRSSRTTAGAVAQLEAMLRPLGYAVRGVPVAGCLHLKTAVTQAARDALLLNPSWVDASLFPGWHVVEVDPGEPMAANALLVGDDLVYPAAFAATARRLRAHGLPLHAVDVSEIAKAEGGVTCCSLVFDQPDGVTPAS